MSLNKGTLNLGGDGTGGQIPTLYAGFKIMSDELYTDSGSTLIQGEGEVDIGNHMIKINGETFIIQEE